MKHLDASAAGSTAADPQRAVELLADVEAYPQWYPDVVRSIAVLERDLDGAARRVRATLRAAVGPVTRDLGLTLEVIRGADTVTLRRLTEEASDGERFAVEWQVTPGAAGGTGLHLHLDASLEVPRLMPIGGVGDALANGFVDAAVRRLDEPAGLSGRQPPG